MGRACVARLTGRRSKKRGSRPLGSKKNGDGNEGQEEDGMGWRKAIAASAACVEQAKRGIGRQ
eukprot:1700744-Pyramimonas_sp.AAC.1